GEEDGWGRLGQLVHAGGGRVDPLLERSELLALALGAGDHQLAVEHVAAGWEAQLWEVTVERLAVARLDEVLVAVAEDDRTEAVELRLEAPAVALGQRAVRSRELGGDRGIEREMHWCI